MVAITKYIVEEVVVVYYYYEVRQVDAWRDGDGWVYNETWPVSKIRIRAKSNERRALQYQLRKLGIVSIPGRTVFEWDGSVWELVARKTGQPLFCIIPEEEGSHD